MGKIIKYCCSLIDAFLNDVSVPIKYSPRVREYSLLLQDQQGVVQSIDYCPWCGTKLPDSLRKEYFDFLKTECFIDDSFDQDQKELIPEEFKSDAWWKKRGL